LKREEKIQSAPGVTAVSTSNVVKSIGAILLLLGLLGLPDGAFAAHSVRLDWKASTSVVAKYKVYRILNCSNAPVAKATVLSPTISWIDTQVSSGKTYCYQVTAIDRFGRESGPSNRVRTKIPVP
jgi:hypothetical protein